MKLLPIPSCALLLAALVVLPVRAAEPAAKKGSGKKAPAAAAPAAPNPDAKDEAAAPRPQVRQVTMFSPVAVIGGTYVLPPSSGKPPCVVILPDSQTDDRDGAQLHLGLADRDALKRLADALAAAGYASLRFDRIGFGASAPTQNWQGTYSDEVQVVRAAIGFAHRPKEVGKIIVLAEGDAAYLACLAAEYGGDADAYVFLNPPCGTWEDLYAYR